MTVNTEWKRFRFAKYSITLITIFPLELLAADWKLEPYLISTLSYEDNILFSTSDIIDSVGYLVSGGICLSRSAELSFLSLTANINAKEYSEPKLIDSIDPIFTADIRYKLEKNIFRLSGYYKGETTKTSELEVVGPVQKDFKVSKHSIQPAWTHKMSEASTLNVEYLLQIVDYNAPASEFSDHTYNVLSMGYKVNLSERSAISLNGSYSVMNVPDKGLIGLYKVKNKSTSKGLFIGLDYKLSQLSDIHVELGKRITEQTTSYTSSIDKIELDKQGDGAIFSINFNSKGERSSSTLTAKRELVPTGDGELKESLSLNFIYRSYISSRLHDHWSIGMQTIESSINTNNLVKKYSWLEVGVEYSIYRNMNIGMTYRYGRNDINHSEDIAESNRIMINLIYDWPSIL
jgi:opacity protein-like surface antigen